MEAIRHSETSVNCYQITRRHVAYYYPIVYQQDLREFKKNTTVNRLINSFLARQKRNFKGTRLRLQRVNLAMRRKEIMFPSSIYEDRAEFDGLSGRISYSIKFSASQVTLSSHTGTIRKLCSWVKDRVKSSGEPFLTRRHFTEDVCVSKCCVRRVNTFHGIRTALAVYTALPRLP
jgi:hypothetical protein